MKYDTFMYFDEKYLFQIKTQSTANILLIDFCKNRMSAKLTFKSENLSFYRTMIPLNGMSKYFLNYNFDTKNIFYFWFLYCLI
jgi:hypothetical protein